MFKSIKSLSQVFYHSVKNLQQYQKLVKTIKTPYLVDFYADWCGPCRAIWPLIQKKQKQANGKWVAIKVNVDTEELAELVSEHNITGVPTFAVYKDGAKSFQKVGGFANDKQLNEFEKKYLL